MVQVEQIKHLVIADDDDDDQLLLQEVIKNYSDTIKITEICDGKKLMSFLSASQKEPSFSLLLLDLNMPYKNGAECLSEIKKNNKLAQLPIVILSTSRNIKDIEECYENGASLFFTKPCSFNSLKVLIHSILSIQWKKFKQLSKEQFMQIATQGFISLSEENVQSPFIYLQKK
ncbi:MAG: response regulator [Bacteroidia bacterium]